MTDAAIPAECLDILVPVRGRLPGLAVTLTGLAAQSVRGFRVVVSDQSEPETAESSPLVRSAVRILNHRGNPTRVLRHAPPRGMAEQRAFLLAQATASYVLFLDADVWLEPDVVSRLLSAMAVLRCGFVGAAVQGLSYADDVRPDEQEPFEPWEGPVRPERVRRGEAEWERHRVHNAANLLHVERKLRLRPGEWRAYKVAWVGGCVLYDRRKLACSGGFDFWPATPPAHAGEDVAAQLRVMERYGGAGVVPSGAFHLELSTTVEDRRFECYDLLFDAATPHPERV